MSSDKPSLRDAFLVFLRIGLLSFGGPAAQISLMHKELVDARPWLSEKQFLSALSFCMLLPGPEAMQLATYAGWRLYGVLGGVIAGFLFVAPGALVILSLSLIYAFYGATPLIEGLFIGVKAAVLIIVIEALSKVSKRALKARWHWVVAAIAFIAIFFLNAPFPLIIIAAAGIGFWLTKSEVGARSEPQEDSNASLLGAVRTFILWLAIWVAPIAAIWIFGGEPLLLEVAGFFSKLAVVTFGGAYAVLAYMAQDVVTGFGWLTAGEMMDGLGLAETTPGPLILVTQFVGFLAGFGEGGWLLALASAAVTLWVTFIPCFLWIFLGAPYIASISARPRLNGALSGITAAVVGVILNLSLWFALHVFFFEVTQTSIGPVTLWQPTLQSIDWRVAVLAGISAFLLLKLKWGIGKTLPLVAALGWGLSQIAYA